MGDNTTVQVALRIRPLVQSEKAKGCQDILEVYNDLNQVKIKTADKSFTYNYVFDHTVSQLDFYNQCVKDLILNLFKGYNVTILAYGQTGSGKTHSMGTLYNGEENAGIIPRAVQGIFDFIKDNFSYDFAVSVSFIEIYQEVVYDLLANKPREQCCVDIREDITKGIIIPGLTEEPVKSPREALDFLTRGSQGRAMASTNMNAQSSRSHAVFTLNICMQNKTNSNENKTARFHLVDLAGSERQKKTGATGQTFKEGVNINKGLLALGNVIAALGDEKTQNNYICYRDSCLTRLLKDSLGGNSITLMIACVSPADYNVEETLSTLRYADRARKIKNKPVINQDPKAAEINKLQKVIQQLRQELVGQGGSIICPAELELLKKELSDSKAKCRLLNVQLATYLNDNGLLHEKLDMVESIEELILKAKEILKECNVLTAIKENGDYKEEIDKLKEFIIQLTDLNVEQMKIIKEITKQEIETYQINGDNDSNSEHEISERQEGHTAQQLALNNEFQEVRRQLAMKEKLVKCMESNALHTIDPGLTAEYESKIATLETEKAGLLQQLQTAQTNGVVSKISENRRKRLLDLEEQIREYKRKLVEQERLIKLKKADELKIKQLNNEIVTMKQNKVSLMKKIRQESDRFRTWKLQKERDLNKLKEQDRKRQNQIIKMEMMHNRQQNVLKRKVEEAAAVNKRLKESLAKRKVVIEKKQGRNDRIGEWIQQELEIHVNILDAEITLAGLLEDRTNLQKQLDFFEDNPEVEEDPDVINQLSEDIQLRSAQIAELQQKMLDSQEDSRSQTRFDHVQSMCDAKQALKTLFDLVTDIKRGTLTAENKIQDQQREIENLKKDKSTLENKMKQMEQSHCDLDRQYEEKIALLLGRVNVESQDDGLKQILEIQKTKISSLERENEDLKKEMESLKEKIRIDLANAAEPSINVDQPLDATFNKPTEVFKIPKKQFKQKLKNNFEEEEDTKREFQDESTEDSKSIEHQEDTSSEIIIENSERKKFKRFKASKVVLELPESFTPEHDIEDNILMDPDWHKTPLGKKLRSRVTVQDKPKRTSQGGCACKTNCSSRNCGCRKTSKGCNEHCKCSIELCANRGIKENELKPTHLKEESDDEDDSFLRKPPPKVDGELEDITNKTKRFKKRR